MTPSRRVTRRSAAQLAAAATILPLGDTRTAGAAAKLHSGQFIQQVIAWDEVQGFMR